MSMKNPLHPGRMLKSDIDALGLSVADVAIALRMSRQQLYRVLRCTAAITPVMALRLEAAIGSTADMWLRLQASHDLAQGRKQNAAAGVSRVRPRKTA